MFFCIFKILFAVVEFSKVFKCVFSKFDRRYLGDELSIFQTPKGVLKMNKSTLRNREDLLGKEICLMILHNLKYGKKYVSLYFFGINNFRKPFKSLIMLFL